MDLWEFNACVKEYSKMQEDKADMALSSCWQTAAFTGSAFAGKLKKLSYYKRDNQKSQAPKVDKNEFDRKLADAERRLSGGITKS